MIQISGPESCSSPPQRCRRPTGLGASRPANTPTTSPSLRRNGAGVRRRGCQTAAAIRTVGHNCLSAAGRIASTTSPRRSRSRAQASGRAKARDEDPKVADSRHLRCRQQATVRRARADAGVDHLALPAALNDGAPFPAGSPARQRPGGWRDRAEDAGLCADTAAKHPRACGPAWLQWTIRGLRMSFRNPQSARQRLRKSQDALTRRFVAAVAARRSGHSSATSYPPAFRRANSAGGGALSLGALSVCNPRLYGGRPKFSSIKPSPRIGRVTPQLSGSQDSGTSPWASTRIAGDLADGNA